MNQLTDDGHFHTCAVHPVGRDRITFSITEFLSLRSCVCAAIMAIKGLVALTALGMDWTEDDTVKTTMNGISNITFILSLIHI